jgi:hypothetical protein
MYGSENGHKNIILMIILKLNEFFYEFITTSNRIINSIDQSMTEFHLIFN